MGANETMLPILKVLVHNEHGTSCEATVLLNSGSQQSLIGKEFAQNLQLAGRKQVATFSLAGGQTKRTKSRSIEVVLGNDILTKQHALNWTKSAGKYSRIRLLVRQI